MLESGREMEKEVNMIVRSLKEEREKDINGSGGKKKDERRRRRLMKRTESD